MRLSLTVQEFCDAHGISRATFYVLQKRGDAPTVMKVGKRTLVSAEAAEQWRRRMERVGVERNPAPLLVAA